MKVFLYFVGRPKDPHANAMAAEYLKRTGRYCAIEMREIRPGKADFWEKHRAARKIVLDPAGQQMDSARFAAWIARSEMEGRDLVFVLGGADGLPADWRARADLRLSLAAATYPHELARVMLAEQIYRAFTTLRGHPYPR